MSRQQFIELDLLRLQLNNARLEAEKAIIRGAVLHALLMRSLSALARDAEREATIEARAQALGAKPGSFELNRAQTLFAEVREALK